MIFFDATEKMSAETEKWVWGELLPAVCDGRMGRAKFVLCGRKAPEIDRLLRGAIEVAELNPLTRDYILAYLGRRGVEEKDRESVADMLMLATEGNLFKLAALVDGYLKLRESRASGMNDGRADGMSRRLEEFRRLLGELPPGPGGSVELVLSLLRPDAAELLRLAAIPHLVDRTVAAILMPDAQRRAARRGRRRAARAVVRARPTAQAGACTTRRGATCSAQWIAARDADPERWRRFREANARLADYYAGAARAAGRTLPPSAARSITGSPPASPAPSACSASASRRRGSAFRLEACEALVTILADLEPLLGESERGWLRYARARLLADQRQFDQARSMLEPLRARPGGRRPTST